MPTNNVPCRKPNDRLIGNLEEYYRNRWGRSARVSLTKRNRRSQSLRAQLWTTSFLRARQKKINRRPPSASHDYRYNNRKWIRHRRSRRRNRFNRRIYVIHIYTYIYLYYYYSLCRTTGDTRQTAVVPYNNNYNDNNINIIIFVILY